MTQTFQVTNGDVAFSSATGRPLMVSDRVKLEQDLKEATSIDIQPNGFGFGLNAVIGQIGDVFSLQTDISRRIRDGLSSLIRLQQSLQRAQRTAGEVIVRVVRIVVQPILRPNVSTTAATAFSFRFDVVTMAGSQTISSSGTIIPPTG